MSEKEQVKVFEAFIRRDLRLPMTCEQSAIVYGIERNGKPLSRGWAQEVSARAVQKLRDYLEMEIFR